MALFLACARLCLVPRNLPNCAILPPCRRPSFPRSPEDHEPDFASAGNGWGAATGRGRGRPGRAQAEAPPEPLPAAGVGRLVGVQAPGPTDAATPVRHRGQGQSSFVSSCSTSTGIEGHGLRGGSTPGTGTLHPTKHHGCRQPEWPAASARFDARFPPTALLETASTNGLAHVTLRQTTIRHGLFSPEYTNEVVCTLATPIAAGHFQGAACVDCSSAGSGGRRLVALTAGCDEATSTLRPLPRPRQSTNRPFTALSPSMAP